MKQTDDAAVGGTPPPAAARHFPADRLRLAGRYAELLTTDGVVRGLIGPREAPRIWERHLLNSALMAPALPRDASVADIGSGAGLPGLVVAIARPDLRVTLVEPLLRRTTFLAEVVAELGLDNVRVVRGRADALHGSESFEVVTARAVAALDVLAGWCMPLVGPTGALLAMKGSSVAEEIEAARPALDKLGCAPPVLETYGADSAEEGLVRVVRVTWADPARVSLRPSTGFVSGRSRDGRRSSKSRRKS